MEREENLDRAIRTVGGFTKTAAALGLTPGTVHQWQKCPLHWAKRLAELANMHPHDLAPDHYDPPAQTEDAVS